jgi:hypothetical protein
MPCHLPAPRPRNSMAMYEDFDISVLDFSECKEAEVILE